MQFNYQSMYTHYSSILLQGENAQFQMLGGHTCLCTSTIHNITSNDPDVQIYYKEEQTKFLVGMVYWFTPIEGPLQQELASGLREFVSSLVRLKDSIDHALQPGGPLLERVLLLESRFEVLLQSQHQWLFTFTHPGGLLLHHKTTV